MIKYSFLSAYCLYFLLWLLQLFLLFTLIFIISNGNKDFKKLKNLDKNYIINNFRYTILEIFDFKTNKEELIEREHFWMDVLDTRKHGMNNN